MLQALIWDVDGTVAETERDGHRVAFNQAFVSAGLPWRWSTEDYGGLLRVTGGRERLLAFMQDRDDAPDTADERERLARDLHQRKNAAYAEIVAAGLLPARPGVIDLMRQAAESHVGLAIATTTSRANVQALFSRLLGAEWRDLFAAVVCGEDVPRKKPDPAAYQRTLQLLHLPPDAVLALEDSPPGLQAAAGADIAAVWTPSTYFPDAEGQPHALRVDNLAQVTLADLLEHARLDTCGR